MNTSSELHQGTVAALAGMAQLVGHHLEHIKVACLIPGQVTGQGSGLDPWQRGMQELIDVSLSHWFLSPSLLPLPLSLKNQFKNLLKK